MERELALSWPNSDADDFSPKITVWYQSLNPSAIGLSFKLTIWTRSSAHLTLVCCFVA